MIELRNWLLERTKEMMDSEGAEDTAHDFDHLVRVMAIADSIQTIEGGDLPTIWAAVAFHDIGQARERRYGGDHASIGAAMAADILINTSFPQNAIPIVQQAIRDHRMTGGTYPQSLEGRILYDADKIDCLGAIGIARLYCITGRYNQKIYTPLPSDIVEPVDPLVVRRLRRQVDYSPIIEFQLLFGDLPSRMTTRTGREMAKERYLYMVDFFKRLQKEVEGQF